MGGGFHNSSPGSGNRTGGRGGGGGGEEGYAQMKACCICKSVKPGKPCRLIFVLGNDYLCMPIWFFFIVYFPGVVPRLLVRCLC